MENPVNPVVGGPEQTAVVPPVNSVNAAPPVAPPVEPPKVEAKPILLGGRRFNSPEELAEYASGLERKNYELEAKLPSPAQSQILEEAKKPKLSDLMFEDPEGFAKLVKQQAKDEAMLEITQRKNIDDLWGKFFGDNPDLSNAREIVEFKRQQLAASYGNRMPPAEEFFSKLADMSRQRLSEVRGTQTTSRELPSGPARVADGSRSGSGQGVKVETSAGSNDLVSQVRGIQNRKRG